VNPVNLPRWLAYQSKSRFRDLFSDYYLEKNPTIMIDGGLGSQMIGWIKFQIAQEMYMDKRVQLDLSYFASARTDEIIPGITKREWALDHYGIHLMDLHPQTRPFLTDISYEKRAQFEFPFFQRMVGRNWADLFPIKESTFELLRAQNLPTEYGVVHLRRGDYLQVASKIVEEKAVTKLLEKIGGFLPQTLLVISDSEISQINLDKFKKSANVEIVQKIVGGNVHTVHGLMRQAKILIASNSTYSMSAALTMTNSGMTVFPTNFYGTPMPNLNRNLNSLANWHLHGDFETGN
jgi:hypothetical protein